MKLFPKGTSLNRLQSEKSIYLKQHSEQPVHWWPYSQEAVLRSQEENKPIFLSIGYSSCHWCHVMADESFESEEISKFLNDNFICIKVDKEEFPDLDHYYQQACHLFTQSGGWPLSAFLMPDMKPYYAGTYFPPFSTEKGTGFLDIIKEMSRVFNEDFEKVKSSAQEVVKSISEGLVPTGKVEFAGHFPPPMAILDATKDFRDTELGGHGAEPKFPNFAYHEWSVEQILEGMVEKEFGDHVIQTIDALLFGGIFDHVRGGIHRYSIDKNWQTPHFEKMLYDQAGFLSLLSKTALIYPTPSVYDALMQTLDYLETEMLSDQNYFFSSQDADSEGIEGLYFTYTFEEFEEILNKFDDEQESFQKNRENIFKWFNVTKEGNFVRGLNIINLNIKEKDNIFEQNAWEIIRKIRHALLETRKLRLPPGTDTKGVASWNFLMVSSLTDVIQYCPIDTIKQMASNLLEKVVEGITKTFIIEGEESDKLTIAHTTTTSFGLSYLEDYVFFAQMQLRLYELTGNNVFRENFTQTMSFVKKEFVKDGELYTRALSQEEYVHYPNQKASNFDTSYRSPSATYYLLARRASILEQDQDLKEETKNMMENVVHEILKNPINAGEALRAFTYPDEAYRIIKVPKDWPTDSRYTGFIPYFLPRFVLSYHDEGSEWQICGSESCELQGDGLENFIQTLNPNQPSPAGKDEKKSKTT